MTEEVGYDLRPEQVLGKKIVYTRGHGQVTVSGRPNFDETMAIYDRKIASGEINNNPKFPEDRKLRLDSVEEDGDHVIISLGVTDFFTFKKGLDINTAVSRGFREEGIEKYGNVGALFPRATGAAVLPISKEGNAIIGPRANKELNGWLNGAAGYLEFVNPNNFDPEVDALRELWEEYGIPKEALVGDLQLVGISHNLRMQDPDISYVAQTNMTEEEIRNAWLNLDSHEHQYLMSVRNPRERDLLFSQEGGAKIMAGTALTLETMTEEQFSGLR